jgi:hypothetical protein
MLIGRSSVNSSAYRFIAEAGAQVLLGMAITLQTTLMVRLNVLSPRKQVRRQRDTIAGSKGSTYTVYTNPSKPGEYLKKRTGWLQGHVVYYPTTVEEIARLGYIRVGYGQSAFYGGIWELKPPAQKRKGLLDALDEVRPLLLGMMGRTP